MSVSYYKMEILDFNVIVLWNSQPQRFFILNLSIYFKVQVFRNILFPKVRQTHFCLVPSLSLQATSYIIYLYLLTCSHSITRTEQNNNFPIYNFGSQTVTVELYTSFCLDLAWLVWAGSSGLTTVAQWTGTPLSDTAWAAQLRWDRRGANMWHSRLPWWQS